MDTLTKKNDLILELNHLKSSNAPLTQVRAKALQAATLEGTLAQKLINEGRHQDALVNLISQVSCLVDAQEINEATRICKQVLNNLKEPKYQRLKEWLIEVFEETLDLTGIK